MNHKHLIKQIKNNLTPDLLIDKYKNTDNNILYGHCYVATECFYHFLSENEKGAYKPHILKFNDIVHWFLKNTENGDIIDITKEQFDFDLDYSKSRACGFLTKAPSKRTKILMSRIICEIIPHHKLIYNNTIFIFFSIKTLKQLKNNELMQIKNKYLSIYENCVIYNELDLKNKKSLIKDKINKTNKNKNLNKVHARNCKISIISNKEKNEFLNKYHIQGTDKSQIILGSFFNDELVSVMCFDEKRGINGGVDEINTYELSRFATKNSYIIVGIFNKMLMFFIRNYSPNKIISFADKNYVNPNKNIYTINNFKLTKTLKPDYQYYYNNKLYHKLTFGLKFKKNKNLSNDEYKNTLSDKIKIWNSGKLKYELFLNNNEIIYGYIYKISNNINNKIYIGQTIRPLIKRIYEYKSALNTNTFHNNYLGNTIKKYGFENFEFSVIDTAKTIEELNEKEINWIKHYNSTDKNIGYNIELGGSNALATEDTKTKMSQSHSGIKQTQHWINKRIAKSGTEEAKKYGKAKTEEEKKYLSEVSPKYWLGKSRDEETRKKISKTKKELGLSDKQKQILCKRVIAFNPKSNEVLNIFDSTVDASKYYSLSQSTISRRCSGRVNNNGEVFFRYE